MIIVKLIIFAGITGFNKSEFIQSFALKCLEKNNLPLNLDDPDSKRLIRYIKFEDELLKETDSADISLFLAIPSFPEKIKVIERTYIRIGKLLNENISQYVFLDIHLSCLYHSQFFPPIYAANLRELDPLEESQIQVITLIDDVYHIWDNLKKRELEYPGTSLRLREILSWRSVELLQAESVAFQYTTENRQVRNYLVAINHPFISLYNLIFQVEPVCLYLSYPISRTRSSVDRIQNINEFRKNMFEFSETLGIVIFDPVTIDELALNIAIKNGDTRVLEKKHRWPLDIETLIPENDWSIKIPQNEVQEAMPDIFNNISQRDFKLIDQSLFTTVYRKNFGGPSKGVQDEIRYSNFRGKRVYVYDPPEDTNIEQPHPFDSFEIGFRNLDDFYKEIQRGLEQYIARHKK